MLTLPARCKACLAREPPRGPVSFVLARCGLGFTLYGPSCSTKQALLPIWCLQALRTRLHAYGLATALDACALWHVAGAAALPDHPPARRVSVLLWQLLSGVSAARCGRGMHGWPACHRAGAQPVCGARLSMAGASMRASGYCTQAETCGTHAAHEQPASARNRFAQQERALSRLGSCRLAATAP